MPVAADPARSRFDLDAVEFGVVRRMLTARLASPLGGAAVDALTPAADAAEAMRRRAVHRALAARLTQGEVPPMAGVVDVRSWLAAFFAHEHKPDTRELADLKRCLRAAERCRRWLGAGDLPPAALVELGAGFPRVGDVAEEMDAVLDDRGEVLSSASPKLAQLRADIEAAELQVQAAVRQFLADDAVRRALQSPEPAWRHGRPTFAVKQEHRHRVPGVLHDRSASGQTLFIEPPQVVEAANRLSDARAKEQHEIQVVIAHLLRGLHRVRREIESAVARLAALDLAQACAQLIGRDGFLAAPVVDGGPLRLVGARHPQLLSQGGKTVVPLDLALGDPYRLLVVTGPNTGGKTVTLKTVGVLAAMALCGVPVPAEPGTAFPFFDGIFVDIGDEQGIAQNLSTFSGHVRRIARCLALAGDRSLVLLDELGAGTDPDEGGVLGYAVLEALAARGALALVTTHIGRLKDFAYDHTEAENGAMAFDQTTLAPLYQLVLGVPGASHALDVAAGVGMPEDVVRRARELLGQRARSVEEVVERVQAARLQAEAERRRSVELAVEAEKAESAAKERLSEARRRGLWLEEEASQLVDGELREARQRLLKALEPLRNAPQPWKQQVEAVAEQLAALLQARSLHRRRMDFIGGLRRDSVVWVPTLKRRCTVRKVDRVREVLHLDVGAMQMEVPFEDVSWLQPLDA